MKTTAATKIFYSDDLRQTLGDYDASAELAARLPERFHRWHPLHQAQYLETRHLLPGYILSSQGDRMAMAHGIEGRFPFLDHRLVEFAATLSPDAKLKGLREKHILRQAADGLVPETVRERQKQPYRAPDSSSFTGPGRAEQPYVAEMLSETKLTENGLFNAAAVAKLYGKCRRQDVSGFRDNAAFVGILSTQIWASRFTAGGNAKTAPSPHFPANASTSLKF